MTFIKAVEKNLCICMFFLSVTFMKVLIADNIFPQSTRQLIFCLFSQNIFIIIIVVNHHHHHHQQTSFNYSTRLLLQAIAEVTKTDLNAGHECSTKRSLKFILWQSSLIRFQVSKWGSASVPDSGLFYCGCQVIKGASWRYRNLTAVDVYVVLSFISQVNRFKSVVVRRNLTCRSSCRQMCVSKAALPERTPKVAARTLIRGSLSLLVG